MRAGEMVLHGGVQWGRRVFASRTWGAWSTAQERLKPRGLAPCRSPPCSIYRRREQPRPLLHSPSIAKLTPALARCAPALSAATYQQLRWRLRLYARGGERGARAAGASLRWCTTRVALRQRATSSGPLPRHRSGSPVGWPAPAPPLRFFCYNMLATTSHGASHAAASRSRAMAAPLAAFSGRTQPRGLAAARQAFSTAAALRPALQQQQRSVRRQRASAVVVRAWGEPVEFTSAKVVKQAEVATGLHQLLVDVGPIAAGYKTAGQYVQIKVRAWLPGSPGLPGRLAAWLRAAAECAAAPGQGIWGAHCAALHRAAPTPADARPPPAPRRRRRWATASPASSPSPRRPTPTTRACWSS
jgi:hypothetical protein